MSDITTLAAKAICAADFHDWPDNGYNGLTQRFAYLKMASAVLAAIDELGYAIVPKYPTYEMLMQGLHPAIPGSVTEMYCEMIKAAPKLT